MGKRGQVIYYLAVASNYFAVIAENIFKNKLAENPESTCIVIEKPFGHDLESARVLNKQLGRLFQEKQIYRIDHYLGKETVQNFWLSDLQTSYLNHYGTAIILNMFKYQYLKN